MPSLKPKFETDYCTLDEYHKSYTKTSVECEASLFQLSNMLNNFSSLFQQNKRKIDVQKQRKNYVKRSANFVEIRLRRKSKEAKDENHKPAKKEREKIISPI